MSAKTRPKLDLCNIIGHTPIKRKQRPSASFPGEVELRCRDCKTHFSPLIEDAFDTCPKCNGTVKRRMESYQYCGSCGKEGTFRRWL